MPRVDWPARIAEVKDEYPSIDKLDWYEALGDYDLFGRLLRDILRIEPDDLAVHGGRRNDPLSRDEGLPVLQGLLGTQLSGQLGQADAFSELPFTTAFSALRGAMSFKVLAEKVRISVGQLRRLANGTTSPTEAELAELATAFGKPAWYFAEYRVITVTKLVATHLERSPETSMAWFQQFGLDRRRVPA